MAPRGSNNPNRKEASGPNDHHTHDGFWGPVSSCWVLGLSAVSLCSAFQQAPNYPLRGRQYHVTKTLKPLTNRGTMGSAGNSENLQLVSGLGSEALSKFAWLWAL